MHQQQAAGACVAMRVNPDVDADTHAHISTGSWRTNSVSMVRGGGAVPRAAARQNSILKRELPHRHADCELGPVMEAVDHALALGSTS